MAAARTEIRPLWQTVGDGAERFLVDLGDLSAFAGKVFAWLPRRGGRGTLLPICYAIGVNSIPVVAITGMFIGMVLAVQAYGQFRSMGFETQLGRIVNMSVVRELGPVLAAMMLAGRVGGAMAAELATMRITEQLDALSCLGENPVHYLAVPRFLACVLLIPALTILANFMGVVGGHLVCTEIYHIDSYHYWRNAEGAVLMWDLIVGLVKPMIFGAAIAIISCHRGFNSGAGAEGVGKAATSAFVTSFMAILTLDFFIALFTNQLHNYFWPRG